MSENPNPQNPMMHHHHHLTNMDLNMVRLWMVCGNDQTILRSYPMNLPILGKPRKPSDMSPWHAMAPCLSIHTSTGSWWQCSWLRKSPRSTTWHAARDWAQAWAQAANCHDPLGGSNLPKEVDLWVWKWI